MTRATSLCNASSETSYCLTPLGAPPLIDRLPEVRVARLFPRTLQPSHRCPQNPTTHHPTTTSSPSKESTRAPAPARSTSAPRPAPTRAARPTSPTSPPSRPTGRSPSARALRALRLATQVRFQWRTTSRTLVSSPVLPRVARACRLVPDWLGFIGCWVFRCRHTGPKPEPRVSDRAETFGIAVGTLYPHGYARVECVSWEMDGVAVVDGCGTLARVPGRDCGAECGGAFP
ncbi:uncharacterized protein BXZ73DRAFT_78666 [Epithele typhae]|uniref:uncharacterized protein n=1 Tax=Epithele typhae TaxID=378194 RepID=UPI002007F8D5|nr:uncharacterized protein BXZ73DRAFT_78666 [Epithele typhae]KAH9926562.1 hypothetical protein BXZ73DRAFT_78666 [Epithele typhae]